MNENKAEKALRWVVNTIPDFEPESNEEKMLLTIKHYCQGGADEIKRFEDANAALMNKARQQDEQLKATVSEMEKCEAALFTVVRNSMVMPVDLRLGKSKREITEMTFATIEEIKKAIDYDAVKKLMEGKDE